VFLSKFRTRRLFILVVNECHASKKTPHSTTDVGAPCGTFDSTCSDGFLFEVLGGHEGHHSASSQMPM